jgi:hypothetical protein
MAGRTNSYRWASSLHHWGLACGGRVGESIAPLASSAALGIAIEPEWKPGIVANLAAALNAATVQAEFELPDEGWWPTT